MNVKQELLAPFRTMVHTVLVTLLQIKPRLTFANHWRQFDRLEIGSGPTKRPGWLTLDYAYGADVVWNLKKSLPFPSNCFTTIYSSHVLEHFPPAQLRHLLSELFRVLKPGGKMLICVPDASRYVDAYLANDSQGLLRYQPAIISNCRMDFLNYMFYMDGHHHMMFDMENLKWHLEHAGFKDVTHRDFDQNVDAEARRYESLYAICAR